ncbi:hypothetical protein EZS27_028774 [termite gut metagenome]|uniref:Uncharacterized protein n=1 Tax=termite gut metagenome TaxID=433724 RepID=A0A5J4QKW7_9ZZZZ
MKTKKATEIKNYTPKNDSDELNPELLFNCTATDPLVAIANGQIDPIALAKQGLKNRGLDTNGKWSR